MRLLVLICLLWLAACARPLTEAERAFMDGIAGAGFDPAPVRVVETDLIGLVERTYPTRPRVTCRERIFPPSDGPTYQSRTAGMVLFNRLHTRPAYYLPDYIAREDGALNLLAAMFFAHEMIHVWQWQNRERTGFHPLGVFSEHLVVEDPYLFDTDSPRDFLSYGYEQQASLVEEYVCCRTLEPDGARTARLERLIGAAMDLTPITRTELPQDVILPWDGVEIGGICS